MRAFAPSSNAGERRSVAMISGLPLRLWPWEHQIVYHLPRLRRDGCTALSLTPLEFIDYLAALIRPPRLHRHRCYAVLAPNSPLGAATACARDDMSSP
jgi:hypothetical protein